MLAVDDETEGQQILNLQYMEKCTGSLYVWPEVPATSWEPLESIITAMNPPEIQNTRMQFAFSDAIIKDLRKQYVLK